TLADIGQSESTTFVLPQELTSLVGRYGKHLTGSDVKTDGQLLDSMDFDEETREMLGLDDIEEILGQIDEEAEIDTEAMEQEAEAIKQGADPTDIRSADEVIEEMDEEIPEADIPEPEPEPEAGGDGGSTSGTSDASDGSEPEREPEPE
ncbi:MAG: phosphoesterase, partial [Haloarculaceae archaeon]